MLVFRYWTCIQILSDMSTCWSRCWDLAQVSKHYITYWYWYLDIDVGVWILAHVLRYWSICLDVGPGVLGISVVVRYWSRCPDIVHSVQTLVQVIKHPDFILFGWFGQVAKSVYEIGIWYHCCCHPASSSLSAVYIQPGIEGSNFICYIYIHWHTSTINALE